MESRTKRKIIISGSLFVILNVFMMFSRSPFSIIPALSPAIFSYFMMSVLPTSVTVDGKDHSLKKLNQRTLLITAAVFMLIFIANVFSSVFDALITSSIAAGFVFIGQMFMFYTGYMKPVKPKPSSMEMEKYDPAHDWNHPFSVYRSSSDSSSSSSKSMDESSRRNGY